MSKATGKTAPRRRAIINATPEAEMPAAGHTGRHGARVTMRDIAAAVGVHQTTVSFALRNHPSIPEATRARIVRMADRLGYRPDPLLAAFNFHRLSRHPVRSPPTIAFVVDLRARAGFQKAEYFQFVHQGAREAAARCGYLLEVFFIGPRQLTPGRLNHILISRNIHGVLVAFSPATAHLPLDWTRYCGMKIESLHLTPHLDAISNDQRQVTRLAVSRLRELGYRRIGLATAREDEQLLRDPFRSGFFVESAALPERERVPPLLFAYNDTAEFAAALPEWVRRHRVDAVISNWNNCHEFLAAAELRVPQDVSVASLDAPSLYPHLAGVVQNHHLVGERAVEQLAILMQTHQRDVPATQSITYVPGYWRDGTSAPRKTAAW